MCDQSGVETFDMEPGKRGPSVGQSGPYEYPALEEGHGFWVGKWAEVKRRFIKMAWEDEHSRMVIVLGSVGFIVGILWTVLFE